MSTLAGCGPSDPIQEVREEMAAGNLAESIELLRDLIGEQPDNPELLFLYGRALVGTGQPGLAGWPLRKAMEEPKWYERSAMLLASVESAGGNLENAAAIYAEVVEKNPDNMIARLQRANVCARSPLLYEEALAEVDRILEIAPKELGAYKPRILAYLGLNRAEEAAAAIDALGERIDEQQGENDPIRGWHCATNAIFALEKGDEPLALERWAVCEEKFPTHPNVVAQSVEFHRDRGDLQRALEVAEVAFSADPGVESGYRIMVADLLRGLGRPADAEEILLEAAATDDQLNRAAALLALTEHYKAVGNLTAAAESLERGLTITQQAAGPQPDLIFALADLLIQIGDDERALELTRQMTVAAHRSLVRARVAHDRKNYVKAIKLYEETTRLWPENPYAPYHAGRAAMSAGQFDLAFKNFLLAIRVEDGVTDARFRAGQLLDAEGKPGTAVEVLAGGRAGTTTDCKLLVVEILARSKGPVAGSKRASLMSKRSPAEFGRAIAAAARGVRERDDMPGAWQIVEPLLELDFPPHNYLPILQAAVESAPGEAELAQLRPLIESAVEANPGSASVREIEGMFFERSGDLEEAASSYRIALEAEPERVTNLLRLAGVIAGTDPEGASGLIERALQQQKSSVIRFDPELFLAAIDELPTSPMVEGLFESGLDWAPTSGATALRLAEVIEANEGENERIVRLAKRAIRFGQGEEAVELRDRAQARLGVSGS